jgi:plasmid stability protein
MANLTITIDEQLLKKARMRALEDGTSVNALLRAYLERYAGSGDATEALAGFVRLARRSAATSGPGGRAWTRDQLHDRDAGGTP